MLVAQEGDDQQRLGFIEADRKAGKRITGYEYVVLVTDTDYEILSLGQLYHDRADAEHAGQTTFTLIGLHAHFGKAKQALMRVSACLKGWLAWAAEQFNSATIWSLCCDHLKHALAQSGPTPVLPFLTNHAGVIG